MEIGNLTMPRHRPARRAFTTIEVLMVLLIIGIAAAVSADYISASEANARADRAARQAVIALRYARSLAVASGSSSGVEFDSTGKKIKVYTYVNAVQTFITDPLAPNNLYTIDLANDREVANVTIAANIPTDTTNPYDISFNALGATKNVGTITFTFGHITKTLTIAALADPTIN